MSVFSLFTAILALSFIAIATQAQEQTNGASEKSYGILIGKFNVYHHSVGGSVYAVNETTIFIKNFNYDGTGKDAYFWAGSAGNGPNPNGYIIPDQNGRTNILRKSDNKDFTLTLPENKKIADIKWISVYDLTRLENFGDIYIPDGFQPPGIETLPPLTSKTDDCTSDQIELLDLKSIRINNFNLISFEDQENYFVVGKGHVPTLHNGAQRIPDENGYLEPLRTYNSEHITLTLPGEVTLENIDWLAVYDKLNDKPLGYVTIPSDINVPPSLRNIVKYDYSLPNCEPLHNDFHFSWDVVGQTITIELVAVAGDDDYLGFGISGSLNKSQMIGADVAIGYLNVKTGQGVVDDYNIDAKAPCSNILDVKRGVCKDVVLGSPDSVQVLEGRRVGPLMVLKYRRQLSKADEIDKEINTAEAIPVVWAVGRLLPNGQPGFHRLYPKNLKKIKLLNKPDPNKQSTENSNEDGSEMKSCLPFVMPDESKTITPWGPFKIVDGKLRTFTARLGPSAGIRGYEGVTGMASPGFAWYIHGYLAPELYMQRGLTYSFRVEGGNNPHNVETYHPFIITNEPLGGHNTAPGKVILAGTEITRRDQVRPTAAGRLCIWRHERSDRRLDLNYPTFEKYRNSLKLRCENGSEPAILEVSPNSSWPDVVYYHSYVSPNMGWKINIVDSLDRAEEVSASGSLSNFPTFSFFLSSLSIIFFCCTHFCQS